MQLGASHRLPSVVNGVTAFVIAAGISVGGPVGGVLGAGASSQIVTNCRAFHELSTIAIRSAVEVVNVNDSCPNPGVVFVDTGLGR